MPRARTAASGCTVSAPATASPSVTSGAGDGEDPVRHDQALQVRQERMSGDRPIHRDSGAIVGVHTSAVRGPFDGCAFRGLHI